MIIALDYDKTFTEDKPLWKSFVLKAKEHNHSITFVTFRPEFWDNNDIEDDARLLDIAIVYTNGKQKADCFNADIWIDDMPYLIPSYDTLDWQMKNVQRRIHSDTY